MFLFNAGIRYIRKLIESGELGKVLFVHGQRTNLGPVRYDVNALWDLASHVFCHAVKMRENAHIYYQKTGTSNLLKLASKMHNFFITGPPTVKFFLFDSISRDLSPLKISFYLRYALCICMLD